jgi:hypothetical protein
VTKSLNKMVPFLLQRKTWPRHLQRESSLDSNLLSNRPIMGIAEVRRIHYILYPRAKPVIFMVDTGYNNKKVKNVHLRT